MKLDTYAMLVVTQNGVMRIVPTKKDYGEWVRKVDVAAAFKRYRINLLDEVPKKNAKLLEEGEKAIAAFEDASPVKRRGRPLKAR